MEIFRFVPGDGPLVVSMPHPGTHIPDAVAARLTAHALTTPDTDWHLARLYDFLAPFAPSVLVATHSRYVVDLNRPPDDANLYPGQDTTGLVPLDTSERVPLYIDKLPDAAETAARRDAYWRPYHAQLERAIETARARHGYALLWDAHSIKSELPRYFRGRLPDLNIGTGDGAACGAGLGAALLGVALGSRYSSVLDGRFKGGYITRRYGEPRRNVHAVQLELSWATYMDEAPPYSFREDLAAGVRPVIAAMMETFVAWGARHGRG